MNGRVSVLSSTKPSSVTDGPAATAASATATTATSASADTPPPAPGSLNAPVRRLDAAADRARCSELAVSRGWGAEERKWELVFEIGEVYGIEDESGGLIAASALTRYGAQFAALSRLLVAESHEHQGFGTRMLRHVIEQAAGATLVLHAKTAVRTTYEQLGFKAFGSVEAHIGTFDRTGTTTGGSEPALPTDVLQIARLDREVYGAHRTALIKRLPQFADKVRVLRGEGGLVTGYGAAWRNGESTVIGPVLAPDFAGARDLVADLADGVEGEIRLEVDHEGDDLSAWACGHGLKAVHACTHMALNGQPPMDLTRLHAPLMCSLG